MAQNASERRIVHGKLAEIAGEREADLMMDMFTDGDVASRVDELRSELHIELTAVRTDIDSRFGRVDTQFADSRASIEHALRMQLAWLMGTMVTLTGIIVAAFAAFH